MTKRLKQVLLGCVVAGLVGLGIYASPSQPTSPAPAPTVQTPAPTQAQAVPPAGPAAPAAPTQATLPPDPCSAVRVNSTTAGGAGSPSGQPGFPDEGFDIDESMATPASPKPNNPVQKSCENGRIELQMGAIQHYGHRIADIVEIRTIIVADKDIIIDFTSLTNAKTIAYGGSNFFLAKDEPVTIRRVEQDKKAIYIVDMRVQTATITEPGVPFNLDLRYATELVKNSTVPDWKVLSTPELLITRSNTVDNGEELLEGDLQAKGNRASWLLWPVFVTGFFLIFLWPGLTLVNWLNRIRPGRKVPPNEIAWRKFNRVIKDAEENGKWEVRHYKQIAAALRIGIGYAPHTRLEILDRVRKDEKLAPKYDVIKSALEKLDMVLYAEYELSTEETEELVNELPLIIPRPE